MRKTKGIIKNYEKFKIIKVPRGLDLKTFKATPRKKEHPFASTSINKFGGWWFEINGKKAIFKTFDSNFNQEIRNLRIVNELICQELAEQVGIKHAKYQPASLGRDNGLVSYNVANKNQELVTMAEFLRIGISYHNNLVDVMNAINDYKAQYYQIDKKQVIVDLYKIMVFDALTLQSDRHCFNINFLYNKKKTEYCIAPMFDNEYAFNLETLKYLYENEPDSNFDTLISHYSENSKFFNVQYELSNNERTYKHNVANLANLAKNNKQMAKFMAHCLEKIDVGSAINHVEKLGYSISIPYKLYMARVIENTKELFVEELNKPKSKNSKDICLDYII